MTSLYGQIIQKDTEKKYIRRPEKCLLKNYDKKVVEYEPVATGEYFIK